ncbi:MAG: glycosyltransferase family 2 protein [Fimbriimonadaceae bacterium]
MPRVSVLVPSFRHAGFLDTCLDSIASQTYTDWEAIIVEDCSNDGSLEIANGWAVRDPRFRVFENETNLGAYPTLARAAELAEGEYLAILNSDDVWMPAKLGAQVSLLDIRPEVAACATLGWGCTEDGTPNEKTDWHADWPVGDLPVAPWLLYENRILASSAVFRRGAYHPYCELRYSGDWSALLAASTRGTLHVLEDRAVLWRQHGQNSYTVSPQQVSEEVAWRRLLPRIATEFGLKGEQVRRGLGRNAMNLFALELLVHRPAAAARMLPAMLATPERPKGLKRWLSLGLGPRRARERLWRGQPAALSMDGTAVETRLDPSEWLAVLTSESG